MYKDTETSFEGQIKQTLKDDNSGVAESWAWKWNKINTMKFVFGINKQTNKV